MTLKKRLERKTRRVTVNLSPALYDKVAELAEALQLDIGSTARMLIVEALATRDLHPKVKPLSKSPRKRK